MYFWILRLAALLGHKKARKLVQGQARALDELQEWTKTLCGCQVLWFHAASVGEFEQARPIIEWYKSEKSEYKILLTFFSPSGYELRKNYDQADWVFYMPADTTSNAVKFINTVKPVKAIFIKAHLVSP